MVAQHFGNLRVAKYIKEELATRVPGGLNWEAWLEAQQRERPHLLGFTLPHLLTFVGVGVLALAWTAHSIFYRTTSTSYRVSASARCG